MLNAWWAVVSHVSLRLTDFLYKIQDKIFVYYCVEVHHIRLIELSTNQVYLPVSQWLMGPDNRLVA